MTCRGAVRAAYDCVMRWGPITARAAAAQINWWTPETIEEALDLLVFEGRLVRLRFARGQPAYRRPDYRTWQSEEKRP